MKTVCYATKNVLFVKSQTIL